MTGPAESGGAGVAAGVRPEWAVSRRPRAGSAGRDPACPAGVRSPGLRAGRPARGSAAAGRPPTKASHSAAVNTRAGPAGCRESRTATWPSGNCATSTQLPPCGPLRRLLRHVTPGSSAAGIPLRMLMRLVLQLVDDRGDDSGCLARPRTDDAEPLHGPPVLAGRSPAPDTSVSGHFWLAVLIKTEKLNAGTHRFPSAAATCRSHSGWYSMAGAHLWFSFDRPAITGRLRDRAAGSP